MDAGTNSEISLRPSCDEGDLLDPTDFEHADSEPSDIPRSSLQAEPTKWARSNLELQNLVGRPRLDAESKMKPQPMRNVDEYRRRPDDRLNSGSFSPCHKEEKQNLNGERHKEKLPVEKCGAREANDKVVLARAIAALVCDKPDLLSNFQALNEKLAKVKAGNKAAQLSEIHKWIDSTNLGQNLSTDHLSIQVTDGQCATGSLDQEKMVQETRAGDGRNRRPSFARVCSSLMPDDTCILQFSTSIYYAKEGEDQKMSVDVIRLGSDTNPCSCKFFTSDSDGKAGQRYIATSGTVFFETGEVAKQIFVDIIDSRSWSAALEFKLTLHEPAGCILGRYLYVCRVKVIDPDCFPTNKYASQIHENDWDNIPQVKLLFEYFKFNFNSSPITRTRSMHQVISDQICNLYFVLRLYLGKVVLDKVLKQWKEGQRGGCVPGQSVFFGFLVSCPDAAESADKERKIILLMICAVAMCAPMLFIHWIEYREVFFKIGGTSRKTLQGNLLRKFLNYDEDARRSVGSADLIMAMTRDTESVVHEAYMQIFPFCQQVGRLLMMILLQVFMALESGTKPWGLVPVFIFPVVLITYMSVRNPITTRMADLKNTTQDFYLDWVTHVTQSFRLIADYLKRPQAVEECEARITKFNMAWINSDAVNLNNRYVCLWLSSIVTGIWYIVGGNLVVEGGSEIGTFVTNLQIFNDVGTAWQVIFDVMLNMQATLPFLVKIVRLMNLPDDLEKRMAVNRKRRAVGEESRRRARLEVQKRKQQGEDLTGVFAADFVPIRLEDVGFAYTALSGPKPPPSPDFMTRTTSFDTAAVDSLSGVTMEMPQGKLVVLIGQAGEGKTTLLKLIGGQLIPDAGSLLIPPHLRVLHTSPLPYFLNDTMYRNLTYGVSPDMQDVDGKLERVLSICKKLRMSPKLLKYLDKDDQFDVSSNWSEVLSQTQSALLNLARALVSNPEVLVIHKPTVMLDDDMAKNVFNCLREFVQEKGIDMNPDQKAFRRPRSCIITTSRMTGVYAADMVFKVTRRGVEETSAKNVIKEDLK